ncbi:uncharacterized protein LOC112051674 [Bicyclus anynana]|uniref:Uncharacterized protein LOC112051674 n=1 Tax=Bicyclus anynana TaxID=110368 RepID=A0A6J1NMJ3_BICAN|nr:uncharacterized protein LOC112051674 [Bicyclus anynana]
MDATASKVRNAEADLFGLYLKIENATYPPTIKQKKTVIKYTKLSDDNNSKASRMPQGYILEPRFRRVIAIEEPNISTRRSLKSDVAIPSTVMASDICKRKIVTIEEDDEYTSYYPKFSHHVRKSYTNAINRAVEAKEEKPISQQRISRLTYNSKNSKDVKSNTKSNKASVAKELSYIKSENKYKISRGNNESEKSSRGAKKFYAPPIYKNSGKVDNELPVFQNKSKKECLSNVSLNSRTNVKSPKLKQSSISILKDTKMKHALVPVIHVPLDKKLPTKDVATEMSEDILNYSVTKFHTVDSCVQVTDDTNFEDTSVGTVLLNKVDQGTEVVINNVDQGTEILLNKVDQEIEVDQNLIRNNIINDIKKSFDSLDIPNVSLINNIKSDLPKEDIDVMNKESDALDVPINLVSPADINNFKESNLHKKSSYFISRATLTYTTKQKINFHVIGNNKVLQAHAPSSPLAYPMNVVSVYKNEKKNQENHDNNRKIHHKYEDENDEHENDKSYIELEHSSGSTSVNGSYVYDSEKLVKPSEIISSIQINNSLLHSDYICEQFQRELNFIDSFFESLQYLESCSLSEKCIGENDDWMKVDEWINNSGNEFKHLEFGSFLSKFENEINIDDSKTMASKSLCLLNLLIRDEQRRAKNLLFVLKMREDALKDFTKSQILWLENKKKQDNTDISQLKKKQRGALLKLQHECGEMQRMRKALLTLSERRKLALIKTKKNIEIKLRNSVDVEQIILGKKKLKRSFSSDRNIAPLKCFELSSSGCDDSTTSRSRSATSVNINQTIPKSITSAEKCVQTSDGTLETICMDRSTETGDKNFIVVDGGYLNILFHNLSPEIFSSDKQYEVNKEALNNIVHTSNLQHFNWNTDIVIQALMDQIKTNELEDPNTPSTAHSLVEELDHIYKSLDEEKSPDDGTDQAQNVVIDEFNSSRATEDSDNFQNICLQDNNESFHNICSQDNELVSFPSDSSIDESCTCEPLMVSEESHTTMDKVAVSVSGPLPVPAGAAAPSDDTTWVSQNAPTTILLVDDSSRLELVPSESSLTSPVNCEAEELRRQQLAIEREIKALEQQQCQLLAVREIPDKPPPPYTPPSESKGSKPMGKYSVDSIVEEKIRNFFPDPKNDEGDSMDPFDVFVKDFCLDSIERHKMEQNQKYWDTCNFPPSKPQVTTEKLIERTTAEFKQVLTCVPPTVVSGVGARRSDHIDDILFAEWRRCEPEWTSLHADEVIVKNQVFESIFQKLLSETIDEYKQNVLEPKD